MSGVIELSATYRLLGNEQEAEVTLTGDVRDVLTLLHERYMREAICMDFCGAFTQTIAVRSNETLTVLVRANGRMIGSLINVFDCREESRLLLLPKSGFNVFIHQSPLAHEEELPRRRSRALQVPTRSTLLLSRLLRAVQATCPFDHASRSVLRLVEPTVEEVIDLNEEEYSSEILRLFCTVIEEQGLGELPSVKHFLEAAQH